MGGTQKVRFCAASDGTRIAYATHGRGPPLVRTATWLTHLEFDWQSPVWRHWLAGLGQGHMLVRYDERGCGLSDRDVSDFSLDARIADIKAVADAIGLRRFALLGMSQSGPVAVAFAARYPERVSHLILYATYARGRLMRDPSPADREHAQLMISLIRMGWGQNLPAFRRLFTTLFIPGGRPEQMAWLDELQRVTTEPETAVRIRHARNLDEVTREASAVMAPTLVIHPRNDALVPFAEGRLLATLIPDAHFVALESRNHILLADEPAWERFRAELRSFLGSAETQWESELTELSNRELDVLARVVEGLSNEEIAARLYLSVRTVERHLSNIYAKLRVSGKSARAAAAARYAQMREPSRSAAGSSGVSRTVGPAR
jgi:pimeloyl-ACP methyl ester carboxylesterase/DNA-binding CsgD family transcriptional regulator